MAKAQFHRNQRVWVDTVGTWATVEKVIPHWAKGFDEPVRVTYEVGLGREFLAQELQADEHAETVPIVDGATWRLMRARNKWQTAEDCSHHPFPGTFPVVVTDDNDWGGWRVPGAEYDRDPHKIERQARLIAAAPRLLAMARELAAMVAEGPEDAPAAVRELAEEAAALERHLDEVLRPGQGRPERRDAGRNGRRRLSREPRSTGGDPGAARLGRVTNPFEMRTETPQPIRLSEYRPPAFLIDQVDLDFRLEPNATRVKARLAIRRNGDHAEALRLDGVRLKPISVAIDGHDHWRESDLCASAPDDLTIATVPDAFTLETEVEIDPENNKALEGLYMSAGRLCTQCEAEGFRKITWYPDRPDVLSRFTVRIEADQAAYPRLLSNGNMIEAGLLDDGRHFAVWNDPFLKPCYLFALVAGELDVLADSFVTMSGRTVALRIYVDTGMAPRAAYAMDSLKRSMKWDEDGVRPRVRPSTLFMIVAVRDFSTPGRWRTRASTSSTPRCCWPTRTPPPTSTTNASRA